MNYFEAAQARLSVWISADPVRHHDWLEMSKGLTVHELCAKFAYRESIITDIIEDLMRRETARIVKRINSG